MVASVGFDPLHFFVGVICPQRPIPRSNITGRATPALFSTHGGHRHQLLDVLISARGAAGGWGRIQHEKLELIPARGTTILEAWHCTSIIRPPFVARRVAFATPMPERYRVTEMGRFS